MEQATSYRASRAYAVLDDGGTLTFCRSLDSCESGRQGRLTDLGGAVREDTVYAVPEGASAHPRDNAPWYDARASVRAVACAGERVAGPASTALWFYRMENLASADLSGIDAFSVEDMSCMFYGCSSLASLDLSGWDTSAVRDMNGMFEGCTSLARIVAGAGFDATLAFPEPGAR